MITTTEQAALVAALRKKATFFQRFVGMGENETEILLISAADALTQSDKELKRLREELEDAEDRRGNEYLKLEDTVAEQAAALTELGTEFRDYKIVHPEGTR